MAGRMKRHRDAAERERLAVAHGLRRAGEIVAVAQPHHVEGLLGRQHRAVAGPGVVGMAVGDQRLVDRPHRIDMEAAGRAAKPAGVGHKQVFGRIALRYAIGRAFRESAPMTGPLVLSSSGDLIADRRYAIAQELWRAAISLAPPTSWRRRSERAPRLCVGLVRARRAARQARGARCRDRGLPAGLRARCRGPAGRRAAPGAARRAGGRRHAGRLCARPVRPVCAALRRGAHRRPRLSRAGRFLREAVEAACAAERRACHSTTCSISAAAPGLRARRSGRSRAGSRASTCRSA